MRKAYTVPFKRKRIGKTNYKKRIKLIKSGKPRVVVRKSLNHISLQVVTFDPKGDKILASAHSRDLSKFGWKANTGNICAAFLTGILMAKKAKAGGINEAILDIGLQKAIKGSRIFAAVKGCLEGGLVIPANEEIFPSEERLLGDHITKYAALMKGGNNNAKGGIPFSRYHESKIAPEQLSSLIKETKKKILGESHE